MARQGRNAEETKAAILAAARLAFGASGYDRTTIRAVAKAAQVDPALVMHYFTNKDGLFAAAATMDLALPDLTGVPPGRVADALLPVFFTVWSPGGPFLGLLRATASSPVAAQALLEVLADQITPVLATVARDNAPTRAALIGAQLLGVAMTRYVLRAPPVTALSEPALTSWLRPVIEHYLTSPLPAPSAGQAGPASLPAWPR